MLFFLAGALAWALHSSTITAKSSPLDLTVRNTHHAPDVHAIQAIRRALSVVERDTVFKNSTTLARSWNDAVLFSYTSQQKRNNVSFTEETTVTCTSCYVMGDATAQLTVIGSFNASQAIDNIINETKTDFESVMSSAIDYVEDTLKEMVDNMDFDPHDFPPPTMSNVTFDLDVPSIPEALLQVQFDGLEVYVQLDSRLDVGASYTVNLFTPETPMAITIPGLDIGVWLVLDLILDADAGIDMSNGFHIKLDDGVQITIAMFANNASDITFPGGRFEFLPVTVQSADVTMTATLRLFAKAGIQLVLPEIPHSITLFNHSLSVGGGIVAEVFADVAELSASISAAPQGDSCDFHMIAGYTFNIGAGAAATLTLDSHTWGPEATTSTPIYYTTFTDICATKASSTVSPAAATATTDGLLAKRDLTTTTLTETQIYSGVGCQSVGQIDCPASLQTTLIATSTLTLVTSVLEGITAAFPTLTLNSVPTTVAFGASTHRLAVISGSPSSYVPVSSPTGSNTPGVLGKSTGGVSNKVIIGVSVGVGVPVAAAVAACCWFFLQRRSKPTPTSNEPRDVKTLGTLSTPVTSDGVVYFSKPDQKPAVQVREAGYK